MPNNNRKRQRERLSAGLPDPDCDGTKECCASPHMHGCFADDGDCDHPDEHDHVPAGRRCSVTVHEHADTVRAGIYAARAAYPSSDWSEHLVALDALVLLASAVDSEAALNNELITKLEATEALLQDKCNELVGLVIDLKAAEARADRLERTLATIQAWDCLNPPNADLCADHPWLKQLVDSALGETT